MTSPNPPHSINFELFVNGAWTSIPGDVFQRQSMSITRGYSSESAKSVDPGLLTALLDNRSKNYSPRNPNSPYYSVLKKNTPVRVSVASGGTNYRFWGESAGLTPSADISGKDLTATLQGGGILRRLRQGTPPPLSAPATYYPTTSPLIYWPLEDGARSVSGTPTVGSALMQHFGTSPQLWGKNSLGDWLLPGLTGVSFGIISSTDGFFAGVLPPGFTGVTGRWDLDFTINFANFTGSQSCSVSIGSSIDYTGADWWQVLFTPSLTKIGLYGPGFTNLGTFTQQSVFDNQPHHFRLSVSRVGGATYSLSMDGVQITSGVNGLISVLAPVHAILNLVDGSTTPSTGGTIGHVAYYAGDSVTGLSPTLSTTVLAVNGYPGEAAGNRISRICTENNITLTIMGTLASTQPCGRQSPLGAIDVLQESALVDGGFLSETIRAVGLTYQTIDATYNRAVDLALNYATNHHLGGPLAPVDDDQLLRNDVTVTRKGAGSFEIQQTTGPLRITAPPAGVGKYTDAVTINCLFDYQAQDQAGWRALNLGTVDAARHPSLILNMDVLPLTQRVQVMALNIGARITIDNPPSWLAPDQIDLLLVGMKETLTALGMGSSPAWQIELICQPFAPYRVMVADSATLGRAAPNDGAPTVTCTSNATSWSVATSAGPIWTTAAADFPLDLNVEGEQVTVTNITGASSPQTFTVTRSINGIVKAHTAAVVSLWQPAIAAL